MAIVTIDDKHLTDIADAIRGKNNTVTGIKPADMASAIVNLPSGNNSEIPELFVSLSNYGSQYKPSSQGGMIIDTSNMSTLSFDALVLQNSSNYGAYFSIFLVKVINKSYSINGTTTNVKILDTSFKIATLLNHTHPTSSAQMPFSYDVSEYDEVGIYVNIETYGTSSSTGYSGRCKICNIKGE